METLGFFYFKINIGWFSLELGFERSRTSLELKWNEVLVMLDPPSCRMGALLRWRAGGSLTNYPAVKEAAIFVRV